MKPGIYTIPELLGLRGSQYSGALASMIETDPELAEFISGAKRSTFTSRRVSKKSREDSSTESDELLFQGNSNRRPTQPPPAPQPVQQVLQAQDLNEAEWKYRGRSESEMEVREPLPAPAGLYAQQSEGFQRFYKAVVSPTHVRVTAGGRIVPNTRGPPSPDSKRNKDSENTSSGQEAQVQTTSAHKEDTNAVALSPMPAVYPSFHPPMPGMAPFAMVPRPMGVPSMFPFPPMALPAMPHKNVVPGGTLKDSQNTKPERNHHRQVTETDKGAKNVNLSPPEQFDHTKPFLYNGQWVYPAPGTFPGAFPAPFGGWFLAPPMAHGQSFGPPPPLMMPPPHMALHPLVGPVGLHPPQAPVVPAASGLTTTRTHGPPSHTVPTPPISSIRPSEITTRQLECLRGNLKYHEDQLQYNRHQIDEQDMESKIKMLKVDIERFERVYQAQKDFEAKHYPKKEKKFEENSIAALDGRRTEEYTTSSVPSHRTAKQGAQRKKDASDTRLGINTNLSSEASFECEPIRPFSSVLKEASKTSSLPSGAALAPPFHPRSGPTFTEENKNNGIGALNRPDVTEEQLRAAEKRLLAAGANAFKKGNYTKPSWSEHSESTSSSLAPSATTKADHAQSARELGVPYLIGTLPKGVDPKTAQGSDYVYARQLTDDEIRARYLYWGQAPRSVQHGLPKFDGKNFYPPSPDKVAPSPGHSPRLPRRRGHLQKQDVQLETELSETNGIDPFRMSASGDSILPTGGPASSTRAFTVSPAPSFSSQIGSESDSFQKALNEAKSFDERESSAAFRASESDVKSVESQERRVAGASARLWQNMLKRGLTSSDVLPSAVSSTTAQGYLPQYTGHAVASLNPRIGNVIARNPTPPAKTTDYGPTGGVLLSPAHIAEKQGENRPPPNAATSLGESIHSMRPLDGKHQTTATFPTHWNA